VNIRAAAVSALGTIGN